MKNRLIRQSGIAIIFLFMTFFGLNAQLITVDVDHPGATIQPTMWGIFYEDINMAADGGIYAELVKNRSFEFFNPRTGWKVKVKSRDSSAFMIMNREGQMLTNPRFARIKVTAESPEYCLTNYGFRGMGLHKGHRYRFSVMASVPDNGKMSLRIELGDPSGVLLGDTVLLIEGSEWKQYTVSMISNNTAAHGRLNIWFESIGSVDIDMVSLFPEATWKNRPNGLRSDLVQLLADLKPGFLRFPGGCIVEGRELSTRYEWKKTIGPVSDRQMIVNRWNTEFRHRLTPDYFQSFGLGFYEYFLLAEDIGAEPLPILNCGMACQYNTAEVVPLDQLNPYIQDALDLIEFANGGSESKWGKVRAEMGHPEPFHMKMIGIGNEQWGPQYFERYALFEKSIREKYPDIRLIVSAGPSADGDLFDFAWSRLNISDPQIVDEHYYKNPSWFLENAARYDQYDRAGHKIFAGEYAAQSKYTGSPENQNNWECALAEAAFMTGLERNADVVTMCSYAPLFAHIDAWQWTPDLIWFDNLSAFGTPSYYVQKLFSTNKGTDILKIAQNSIPLTGQQGLYASAVLDRDKHEIIIKLVNVTDKIIAQDIRLLSKKRTSSQGNHIILQNSELSVVNSLVEDIIKPYAKTVTVKNKVLHLELEPYSLNIINIKQN